MADQFLDRLAIPVDCRWLDVGCGTGALLEAIVERARPALAVGVDSSEGFVEAARSRLGKKAEISRASGDALPFDPGFFDVVVSGLVLNFMPDLPKAVDEWSRVVKPGGTVAAYVWDYAEGMQFLRYFWDAAVAVDPAAAQFDEGNRFRESNPRQLVSLFEGAGLSDLKSGSVIIDTVFSGFEDFWSPLTQGQGPAPGHLARVTDEQRNLLASRLEASLPISSTGEIALVARAWTIQGTAA